MQQHQGGFEHTAGVGGPAEKIKLFFIGILEAIASIFALFLEVFVRFGIGRRYFSLLGIAVTYYCTSWMYYITSFISWATDKTSSFKSGIVFDPLDLRQPAKPVVEAAASASPEVMFFALKVFVIVALLQKALTIWRKIRRNEASLTVYGGDSIFAGLLRYVPESWVTRIAVNKDDFIKRHLEPLCCYFLGGWVVAPFLDPLTGSLCQWSAIAMLIRAYCIRLRFQIDLDNTHDSQQKVGHLFDQLGETTSGNQAPVRVRVN